MRRIVWVGVLALLVTGASAQGRGGGMRGGGHGGIEFRPAFTGGHGSGRVSGGRGYGRLPYGYGYGYLGGGGYGYGYAGGDTTSYDAGGSYAYAPQPVFVMPPPPPPVIEPPARPVLTNYTWPAVAPGAAAAAEGETQTFGIVLKDGSTLAATTVVASDDVLHYVDPDERHMRVSMSAVDRRATLKLNRERKLDLYLPASPQ